MLVTTPSADRAVAAAGQAANAEWVERARGAVTILASQRETFTTDDVWERVDGKAATHERRAMGAVMRWAEREGLIRKAGGYVPSRRPECNGRPVAVWLSVLLGSRAA